MEKLKFLHKFRYYIPSYLKKKKVYLVNNPYEINISSNSRELDVILGHNDHMLKGYQRNNVKLKGGWYYRNIKSNTEFLTNIIKKHNIKKINFIGTSKSCSGCVIFTKELRNIGINIEYNLFMFSPYTTVDKKVYVKRKIEDKIPGSLNTLWESDKYHLRMIRRMEARGLVNIENVSLYVIYPEKSPNGEKVLAERITGENVTHLEIPVGMHNTFFPFWKKVDNNREIELYEGIVKKMHINDYKFYMKMQKSIDYNFHLYQFLQEPQVFVQKLKEFIDNQGTIIIGKNTTVHPTSILESNISIYGTASIGREVHISKFSYINSGTTIFPKTKIGSYCSIGKNCEIGADNHPMDWLSTSPFQYGIDVHFSKYANDCNQIDRKPLLKEITTIGDDVWIGSLSLIRKGVNIGTGAIIGAGAVVVNDVPPYAIVGGVPAKVLKYRFSEKVITELLETKWWELTPNELNNVQFDNIDLALEQIKKIRGL